MKIILRIAVLIISATSITLQAAPQAPHCGDVTKDDHYGYDYNDAVDRLNLRIVEIAHFTPNIENLRYGNSGPLGAELSYTLMKFPNHHRALVAFSNLSLKDKVLKPSGARYSVECFFDRAIRFRPKDAKVRMIYGNYLQKAGHAERAIEQLGAAIDLQPEDPTINYNLGLLYMQKKDYEQSKIYAKKAYELGFPLPGLKNKLMEAGKWDD